VNGERVLLRQRSTTPALAIAVMLSTALAASAQTTITAPENKYSVAEDVQLGREAAAEARKQLPMLGDERVDDYVESLGRRLVQQIPSDLQHREFGHTFDVVNVRDINAFALPGGPMFVNRGMIEAATNEGEVAGVVAHEIAHVALRHGTAQASKATKYQLGQIFGAIAGAIIGGTVGDVVAQGTSFGLGTAFLRFGREYERQADILGAQIMARAGYDPRDMANMFKTIEQQSGAGGPEWLSDHPNPGNRSEYITREARALEVRNPVRDTRAFEQVRARLKSFPRAPTTEEAVRKNGGRTSGGSRPTTRPGVVDAPSSRYTQYREGDLFTVSVPSNWREQQSSASVTFAPDGAYDSANGQTTFTHGMEIGVARNESHDLRTATDELVQDLSRNNPGLGRPSRYQGVTVAGRRGLQTTLTNAAEGAAETIQLATVLMPDGALLYTLGVAPQNEYRVYQPHFQRVVGSIRFVN
jgi:Zn-dependent protease with chaperone function